MLTIFKLLWRNLRQGPSTDPFPFGETFTPDNLRGKVVIDAQACAGCSMCVNVCAGGALKQVEREDGSGKDFYCWHNTCTFCGQCEDFCPMDAIKLTNDWSTAHFNEDKFTYREHEFIKYDKCENCDTRMPRVPRTMLDKVYGETTEQIESIYRLCPECRRQKAALQLGAYVNE